ncbi:MAG: hypothetical protein L0Y50_12595 [Beijerinckiaceae bacterium]|nr:hypothetical protein [Beijerinckiaceae bacterium]MCI0737086.1 hypothetical protein [Beijerinckiaceae bacterium]
MTRFNIRILADIILNFSLVPGGQASRHWFSMRIYRPALWAFIAFVAATVWVFAPLSPAAYAGSTRTPWQNLTQAKLTAVWWQWAFSIPVSSSPLFDDTGANAYSGQPYPDLLFLGGTLTNTELQNGDVLGKVMRSISVKRGRAFFFPLLNSEADNVCGRPRLGGNCFDLEKFPNVLGVPELRTLVAALQDPATGLYSRLTPADSQFNPTGPASPVDFARLRSPPFSFALPATDNLYQFFGIKVSGTVAPAVADGVFSLIRGTLAPGFYLLEFRGTLPINNNQNTFIEEISYHITVIP